jgi:hypothetical protein
MADKKQYKKEVPFSEKSKGGPMIYKISHLSDDDLYLFNEGSHFRLYEKLGARLMTMDGLEGAYFSVWAPNAEQVAVMGDFNGWNSESHPLRPLGRSTSIASYPATMAIVSTRPIPLLSIAKSRPGQALWSGT